MAAARLHTKRTNRLPERGGVVLVVVSCGTVQGSRTHARPPLSALPGQMPVLAHFARPRKWCASPLQGNGGPARTHRW